MKTHDYRNGGWGHDVVINEIKRGGRELHMQGWGRGVEVGHFVLLAHADGSGDARYRVESIEYYTNPSDMWNGVFTFAPRTISKQKQTK